MPGDRIPYSALPPAEMGTAPLFNVMQLNFNQADFLMHCIDLFCVDFGAGPASFTDIEGKEVVLDHKQIEDLYLKIQEFKSADNSSQMIIYQPQANSTDRVVWHGGESTQLHYEQQVDGWDGNPDWIDRNVQTLGGGIPTSMSEMHTHMQEFYNYCQVCEFEQRMAMAD